MSFRDTILYNRDLTPLKKYDALFSEEKIKYYVVSEVQGEGLVVRGDYNIGQIKI